MCADGRMDAMQSQVQGRLHTSSAQHCETAETRPPGRAPRCSPHRTQAQPSFYSGLFRRHKRVTSARMGVGGRGLRKRTLSATALSV